MQATDQAILLTAKGVTVPTGVKLPRMEIVAYSGGLMSVPGWGLLAVDLAGLDLSGQVRILADHDASIQGIVGHGKAEVQGGQLLVAGDLSSTTDAARRVTELARNGFEFQASVGVVPIKHTKVRPGEKVEVNGRTLSAPKGGFTVVRQGRLREVSIVSMGADEQTAVSIAASRKGRDNSMDGIKLDEVRAEERERLAYIEKVCASPDGWGKDKDRVEALKTRAIADDLTIEGLQAKLLQILRDARPTAINLRTGPTANQTQVIEASILTRMGQGGLAEKTLGEQVCCMAHDLGAAHMLDLCRATLETEGVDVPHGRMEMVKAALSTYSLPTALGNVANKLLLSAYEESPATWRKFCQVRSVSDFKPNTAIRPSFTGSLEQVAPGGELKHGGIDEGSIQYEIDTFGKLFGVDRRDLINDDLGVFEETSRALGKAAMRKVSDLIYQVLFANAGSFFGAGNGNYLSGATSALSIDSLGQAIQAMLTQRDAEGNDLDIRPATLLVAPENQLTAKAVLESEYITAPEDSPTGNSLKNAVKIEVEPRLSNLTKFGGAASGKEWFLFAASSAAPQIAAFLNGKTTPTVEFFGLDQTVNTLCVSWRVYHDFGSVLCDPRAAVMSVGQ